MKLKGVKRLINLIFMPCVNEKYVTARLQPAVSLHGISIGETSLSFREYAPVEEHLYPLKDSESTDNHIKYKDIAMICERCAFWEILLWNGYKYSLSRDRASVQLTNTHRDMKNMSYFAMKRPVTPEEIARNIRY